jgi:hypothetical protein
MTIQLSELTDQDLFPSSHWVHTRAVGGKHLVTLTGNAIVNFIGTGSEWRRDRVELKLRFPDIFPPGSTKWFKVEHWAPFLTINAIANDQQSIDAGWAVDEFGGPGRVIIRPAISIWANIAIRDFNGNLARVGYSLTVSGIFVDQPVPI